MNRDNQDIALDDHPSHPRAANARGSLAQHPATVAGAVVPRPRLMDHLDRGDDLPLTLVIGPAGFGKTTALRQWTAQLDRPTIWIEADATSDGLHAFAIQVLSSLKDTLDVTSTFGAQTRIALTSGDIHPRLIGKALAEDIECIGKPIRMVVDDFHQVSHSDVPLLFSGLLEAAPDSLRLIISSRWDPRLRLGQLRQDGLVLDIRAANLQFSFEELEDLLCQVLGSTPDSNTVSAILEYTGGWVSAVRLAARALCYSDDPSHFSTNLANLSERHMLDYLMDEVMARKPERLRQLVIRSSIFDRVCGSLADSALALPPGPESTESMLDHLAMVGLVELQREGDEFWYAPHSLFRVLLRHRMAVEMSVDEIDALHRRASKWFEREGIIDRAIAHSLQADEVDDAVAIIERWRLRFFVRERWQEVDRWLDMLPAGTVENHLSLQLTRLRTSVFRGLEAPSWPLIHNVRRLLEVVEPADRDQSWVQMMSELDMVTVHSNSIRENMDDAVAIAERALATLPPDDSAGRGVAYVQWADAMQARGDADAALDRLQTALDIEPDRSGALHARILIAEATIFLRRGDLRRSRDLFAAVLHLATVQSIRTMAGWARVGLGMLAYERNDLGEAEDYLGEVLADMEDVHFSAIREAMVGLVLVALARGDHARADSLIDNLRDWAMDHGMMNALVTVDSLRVRLCLLNGDRRQARQWSPITTQPVRDYLLFFEIPMLTNAKIALHSSSPESITSALLQIRDIERWAAVTHNDRRLVEIKALRAYGLNLLGDGEAAMDLMERVLELVGPEPYARAFLDLGFDLGPIFRRMGSGASRPANLERMSSVVRFARVATHQDFEANHAGFERSTASVRVYEVFTEREVDVLLAISQHLSNKEIGEKLFVSPLTVKRHAINIYRKLGVNSRRQALVKATELGYLS